MRFYTRCLVELLERFKKCLYRKNFGLAISYTPWLRALVPQINLADISLYKKIRKKGTIGFLNRWFSFGDVSVAGPGTQFNQFLPFEYASSVSYSYMFSEKFSGGGALKYIYSDHAGVNNAQTHPGQSLAADISCYWTDDLTINTISSEFSWGVNISNLGGKISYNNIGKKEILPQNIRIGASFKINIDPQNSLEIVSDANRLLVPLPAYNNNIKEQIRAVNLASGIEYWYDKMFALRSGFFYERPEYGGREYFTLGIGIRYYVFGLDFAYLIPTKQRHPLQNTMRFTLSFDFNSFKNEKVKTQPHFIEE